MATRDYTADLDAVAQAAMVRSGEVKPRELVEAAIDHIERTNPAVNAVVTRMYDLARERASLPLPEGPLAGVPFLVKDFLAEYEGVRFTEASASLRDYVSTEDSELVRRYKDAGLITVGKTNLPELAIGVTTEPRLFGPTRNPWSLDRLPGGSSGGAAAAVAVGMVPMAHGNDAGGSIRIPASCCGVFGLKPTRGRNPLGPAFGDMMSGLVAEHALTRTVRDSAALLDATAGPDVGDPYPSPPRSGTYLSQVGADPGRLRVAFSAHTPLGDPLHPDCVAAVHETAALCEELGHDVVEAAPEFDAQTLWTSFTKLIATGIAWAIADWDRRLGREGEPSEDDFEPFILSMAERGRSISASEHLLAVQDAQRASRDVACFFGPHDLWLTPTLGTPPPPLGTFAYSPGGDPFELRRRMAEFSPFTYISNATGQPAASVPLHWSDDGLPIGVHFVGRYGDEATIFRIAAQLEEARPWAPRLSALRASWPRGDSQAMRRCMQ
jgi:amidase